MRCPIELHLSRWQLTGWHWGSVILRWGPADTSGDSEHRTGEINQTASLLRGPLLLNMACPPPGLLCCLGLHLPTLNPGCTLPIYDLNFPGGSEDKASACNAGDPGSIPGLRRSPGEGNGNPLQYSCLENPMDWGAWWATVHRVTKSRTWLSDFTSLHLTSKNRQRRNYLNIVKAIYDEPTANIILSVKNWKHFP